MAEDRLFATFRALDEPIEPEEAFSDRLFESLAVELGFRGATVRTVAGRRWLTFAAVLALLLVLAVGLALVGAVLLRPPDVDELLRRSRAAYDDLPPFAMTVRFDDPATARVVSDGNAVRFEVVDGNYRSLEAGSWILRDGQRETRLINGSFSGPSSSPVVVYADLNELTWLRRDDAGYVVIEANQRPSPEQCASWQYHGLDTVAGRRADVVACGDRRFWIDQESSLVVRYDDGPQMRAVVTSLDLRPDLEPSLFAFEPPPGSPAEPTPPAIGFAPGDRIPRAVLSIRGGGTLDTNSLTGAPSAVYLWCPCAVGPEVAHVAAAARERSGRMRVVVVALAQEGQAAAMAAGVQYAGPLGVDTAFELVDRWRLGGFPALVLLDRQGRLAAAVVGRFSAAELDSMLDDLAAAREVRVAKEKPMRGAGDSISSRLRIGDPAPRWAARRTSGGQLRSEALVGATTVVYVFDGWSQLSPRRLEFLDALNAEAKTSNRRVRVVAVAIGEPEPGALARLAAARGWEIPVVIDWTGRVFESYGLVQYDDVVVLDERGRVLTFSAGCCPDVAALLNAVARGEPLPSPTIYPDEPG